MPARERRVQDGTTLATLIETMLYCGRALSRVGVDLRAPLAPLMTCAVHGLYRQHVQHGLALFVASLEMHKWIALPVSRRAAATGGGSDGVSSRDEDLLAASHGLMAYPPLAVLFNAVRTCGHSVLVHARCACIQHVQAAYTRNSSLRWYCMRWQLYM
jgi:hypothetical protein